MRRLPAALWLAAGLLLGAGAARAAGDGDWLTLDGDDWRAMPAGERMAWAQGFLAGQAVASVPPAVRGDSTALAESLAAGRRAGRFPFPYAAPLYASRLSDYYVWENHRAHPLWRAMTELAAHDRR